MRLSQSPNPARHMATAHAPFTHVWTALGSAQGLQYGSAQPASGSSGLPQRSVAGLNTVQTLLPPAQKLAQVTPPPPPAPPAPPLPELELLDVLALEEPPLPELLDEL